MKVAQSHYHTSLGIHLVDVVLSGGNVYVLHIVATSINQWLSEDLFGYSLSIQQKSPGQLRLKEKTELRAADDGGIHVVVCLISSTIIRTSPGDCVGFTEC